MYAGRPSLVWKKTVVHISKREDRERHQRGLILLKHDYLFLWTLKRKLICPLTLKIVFNEKPSSLPPSKQTPWNTHSCGWYLKGTLFPPISVAVSLDKEFTGRRPAGSDQEAFSVNGSVVWILFLGHFKRVGSSSFIATSCQRQRKARKNVPIFTDNLSRFIWWGTNWEAQVSCFSMLKKGFTQIMSLTVEQQVLKNAKRRAQPFGTSFKFVN